MLQFFYTKKKTREVQVALILCSSKQKTPTDVYEAKRLKSERSRFAEKWRKEMKTKQLCH